MSTDQEFLARMLRRNRERANMSELRLAIALAYSYWASGYADPETGVSRERYIALVREHFSGAFDADSIAALYE